MFTEVFSHRAKRHVLLSVSVLILVFASGVSNAAPPDPDKGNGVPQYMAGEFETIQQMLAKNAAAIEALSTKLTAVEETLKGEIDLAKEEVLIETGLIKTELSVLGGDLTEALLILNEPEKDIQLTTELCFDLGANWDFAYTGKAVGGLGWEGGLKGELSAELSVPGPLPITPFPGGPSLLVPAVSGGVGNTVCLTVPLYAVASNKTWIENFDTGSFDSLVSAVAMPVQYLMPGLAQVVENVFPSPDTSMAMVTTGLEMFDTKAENLPVAGLHSGDSAAKMTGIGGSYLNADPDVQIAAAVSLNEMIMDSPLLGYINNNEQVGQALNDPCGFARSSKLPGADIIAGFCDIARTVDFLCVGDPFHLSYCK